MTNQQQTAFENIVGKEEIARNEQFLLFPQCFILDRIIVSPFIHIFDIISLLFAAELVEPNSEGLIDLYTYKKNKKHYVLNILTISKTILRIKIMNN